MDLEDYRKEIDRLNAELADVISRRMNVVEEIGEYKKQNGIEVRDEEREERVKQQFEKLFERENLPREKGREIADFLVNMAVDKERGDVN